MFWTELYLMLSKENIKSTIGCGTLEVLVTMALMGMITTGDSQSFFALPGTSLKSLLGCGRKATLKFRPRDSVCSLRANSTSSLKSCRCCQVIIKETNEIIIAIRL